LKPPTSYKWDKGEITPLILLTFDPNKPTSLLVGAGVGQVGDTWLWWFQVSKIHPMPKYRVYLVATQMYFIFIPICGGNEPI